MSKVTLVSCDGVEFRGVDVETASGSQTLKTMLENLGVVEGEKEEIIPIPNVSGESLKIVLDWASRHKDKSMAASEETKAWVKELFGSMKKGMLFMLTRDANYLDVESLFDACTTEVAKLFEGKSADELRLICDVPESS